MSVSDIPFNWNAQLDVKKLRVGYIKESFDELTNADGEGRTPRRLLDTLRSIGVSQFVPMTVPGRSRPTSARSASSRRCSSTSMRAPGRMKEARGGGRPNGRLDSGGGVPAVAARADDDDDEARGGDGERRRVCRRVEQHRRRRRSRRRPRRGDAGRPRPTPTTAGARANRRRPQTPTQRHFDDGEPRVLSGDQHAERLHRDRHRPTNVTFFARPFGEMELLALAKAYQDAAGFHLKRPTALDT